MVPTSIVKKKIHQDKNASKEKNGQPQSDDSSSEPSSSSSSSSDSDDDILLDVEAWAEKTESFHNPMERKEESSSKGKLKKSSNKSRMKKQNQPTEKPIESSSTSNRQATTTSHAASTTPTTNNKLSVHVTQIPYKATMNDLRKYFGTNIVRMVRRHGEFTGVAFCDYQEPRAYEKALALHRSHFLGRAINARPVRTPEELQLIVLQRNKQKIEDIQKNNKKSAGSNKRKGSFQHASKSTAGKRKQATPSPQKNKHSKKTNDPKDAPSTKNEKDKPTANLLSKKERNRRAAIIRNQKQQS